MGAFSAGELQNAGSRVVAQVSAQMPVLPDSAPVSQYVRQLGARLVSDAPGYK
jgi:beta-barrel assembly-enhancing protease